MFLLYRKSLRNHWYIAAWFREPEYKTMEYTYRYDPAYQIRRLS